MTQQEIFREKAPHYLLCFVNECPRHDKCLRWLVGNEYQSNDYNIRCVNPTHPDIKANRCTLYRENQQARYAKGMTRFYDQMTRRQEVGIKSCLIAAYGRRQYYEYRNGVRLISPKMQQHISRICQEAGYTAEPHYDGWQDDYLW